jgi:transcriptional regulator with XRE-family HTH domain
MSSLETIGLGVITNLISDGIKKIKFPRKKSETTKIAERLQLILKLMNDGRDENFTIAEFSKILNLKKVSDLEKYFLNEDEPSFKFLKKFSNEFGINLKWLTEGKEHPFKWDQDVYINLYEEYLNKIEELDPYIIYFIRADCANGETCLLLEIKDHKYITLNHFVHFSSQNGHSGQLALVELRKLIMTLVIERNFITKGVIVSKKIFDELYEGKIFPYSALIRKTGRFDYWHDDFTDLYNQRFGYQHHEKYDKNFKDAFNLVKNYTDTYNEI